MKFEEIKIGDRVRLIHRGDYVKATDLNVGDVGTVIIINDSIFPPIGIRFDRNIEGNGCGFDANGDRCEWGHGQRISPKHLEFIIPDASMMYPSRRRSGPTNESVETYGGFRVGDRVRTVRKFGIVHIGMRGRVAYIHPSGQPKIGVQFDQYIRGHDCDNHVTAGYGYYLPPECLELEMRDASKMYKSRRHKPLTESIKPNYKLGDRVRLIRRGGYVDSCTTLNVGDVGTVVHVGYRLGVQFDHNIGGHSCDGRCDYGYGQFIGWADLELDIPDAAELYKGRRHRPLMESTDELEHHKFEIGDRVVHENLGAGTVVSSDSTWAGVRFDNNIHGHTCDGKCDEGHGYYLFHIDFKPEIPDASKMYRSRRHRPLKESLRLELSVGDRVQIRSSPSSRLLRGDVGTVVEVRKYSVGIQFDRNIQGHSCGGNCPNGYGWYVDTISLDRAVPPDASKMYRSRRHRSTNESTKSTFSLGDRVRVKKSSIQRIRKGETGIVVEAYQTRVGVQFDRYINGHDCDGRATDGHGWYLDVNDLELTIPDASKMYPSRRHGGRRITNK